MVATRRARNSGGPAKRSSTRIRAPTSWSLGMVSGVVVCARTATSVSPSRSIPREGREDGTGAEGGRDHGRRKLPGVLSVTAVLTAHEPATAAAHAPPKRAARARRQARPGRRRPHPARTRQALPGSRRHCRRRLGQGWCRQVDHGGQPGAWRWPPSASRSGCPGRGYLRPVPAAIMLGIGGRPNSPDGEDLDPARELRRQDACPWASWWPRTRR